MVHGEFALLNASHYADQTQRNFDRSMDASLCEYRVREEGPPEGHDFAGAVITGSVDSVYDDKAWICNLLEWTKDAIDQGQPLLGICFGHQVIATALGGKVESMGEHEVGYRPVRRVGESRLLDGVSDEFTICHGHSDTVTEVPDGARVIAENDYGVQGLEAGPVFTMQAHPEYDREMAITTVDHYESILTEAEAERAWGTITDENVAAAEEPKRIFENFTAIARTHA